MSNLKQAGLAGALLWAVSGMTQAQPPVSLNAARVGGADVPALAKFYEDAFGLQEVNRLNLPGGQVEVMLNFGASAAGARSNPAAQIVIMHRADVLQDPVPHLILNVADLSATAAAITGAGGKVGKPVPFGKLLIGVATDPAGNQIELIQQPAN